uniref:NADH dehydrogenase subunit 2 n=1 Tax=Ceriagrion auranticum TaxID=410880 RepID=UPI0026E46E30|nr:NADH dehydrogenase subunit 2 [Ceriagrion auranticum]WJK72280.1 NADH dehydrogenase subunit 2 [Ceriagrion auranticum]
MMMNLSSLLFSSTLIMGTLITISAKSWIIMWIGLEINLLSFIPMMNKNKTPFESESSIKYFMTQAMASMLLLMTIIITEMMTMNSEWISMLMLSALFIKMGAPPFHFWFPAVMQGLSWMNCMLLMTWQKIAPMVMMGYQLWVGMFSNSIILMSVIVGAIGGFNQTSIRKLLAYSSISHLGWMITAMMMGTWYWTMYFVMYTLLNIAVVIIMKSNSMYYLSQVFSFKMNSNMKFTLFMSMLSLGGLPPFLGFLPKWMIIQNSMGMENSFIIIMMVMTTMITLYFYLRMTYSAFTLNNQTPYWLMESKNKSVMYMSMIISLMSIPLITMINLY